MMIIKFHDIVSVCDGYGPALIEGPAAPPARPTSPADIVPHEPVVPYHQNIPPVHLREGREPAAKPKSWKHFCMLQFCVSFINKGFA